MYKGCEDTGMLQGRGNRKGQGEKSVRNLKLLKCEGMVLRALNGQPKECPFLQRWDWLTLVAGYADASTPPRTERTLQQRQISVGTSECLCRVRSPGSLGTMFLSMSPQ